VSKFKFTYEGPYVVHRGKMLESDAYRSLGKTELKILARLENRAYAPSRHKQRPHHLHL
jgi:hypothetical protein